jgi:MFS family permease
MNRESLQGRSPAETRLKLVAFALLLSEFVRSLGYNLYSISLPIIAQQLAESAILTGIAVSIFGFVQSTAQIPLGRYSDKHGRKGILLISA